MSIVVSSTDDDARLAALLGPMGLEAVASAALADPDAAAEMANEAEDDFADDLLAEMASYRTANPDVPVVHPEWSADEVAAAEMGEAVFRGRGL